MITRTEIFPLLLEACPSFHNVWGELQRVDEAQDYVTYVGFGALAGHLRRLDRGKENPEVRAVGLIIERFRNEGDPDVQRLAADLASTLSNEHGN